jgi:uncharacterized membrane protein
MLVTLKPLDSPSRTTQRAARHAAPPMGREPAAYVLLLGLIAALTPLHGWWAVQVFLLLALLVVPGLLLLRALRVPGRVVSSFPVYVPCASVVVLLGSGLAADLIGPLLGVAAPLRAGSLLASLEISCLALLAASLNAPPDVAIPWNLLSRSARFAWPLILPLVAAAGALRLNNGHGNTVALITLTACIVMLSVAIVFYRRVDNTLLQIILYAAGLAILWGFSLRGDLVNGFDIAVEYHDMHQAVLAGIWHTGHQGDAYGAMLSVTVMPAELHALSGIPDLLVFTAVYPAIYALFPVAIFGIGRAVLSPAWAFVAAAFVMGQYAFAEMAGFARQEIALVLFTASIAAVLDTRMRRRSQWALCVLLGLAMVLSHYTTTYVAITIIGLGLALQWVVAWFRQIPHVTGNVVVLFFTILGGAVIWYGPVTHSAASGLGQLVQVVEAQGPNILPNKIPGESLFAAFLSGNTKTPIQATRYAQLIHNYYATYKPYITPVPDAHLPQYTLHNSAVPTPPIRSHISYDVLNATLIAVMELGNLLCVFGALLMTLRRNISMVERQIGLFALGASVLLTVLRFSGTLATEYGQERAQIQGLVLLSISLCWLLQRLAEVRERRRRRAGVVAVAAASIAVVFVNTTWLAGAIIGGGTSDNVANSGIEFEQLYRTAPELASARWLGNNVLPGQLIYADEYGQLPLGAMTGITPANGLITDLTPLTLNQQAWVYASRTNVVNGRAFALYKRNLATYVFPSAFLGENYDIVYTDGSSEVFYR